MTPPEIKKPLHVTIGLGSGIASTHSQNTEQETLPIVPVRVDIGVGPTWDKMHSLQGSIGIFIPGNFVFDHNGNYLRLMEGTQVGLRYQKTTPLQGTQTFRPYLTFGPEIAARLLLKSWRDEVFADFIVAGRVAFGIPAPMIKAGVEFFVNVELSPTRVFLGENIPSWSVLGGISFSKIIMENQ